MLTGRRAAVWLQEGDILFISKGLRHPACFVPQNLPLTTAAPSLFLLRVKLEYKGRLNLEFLVWQMNQLPIQRYLMNSAEGSRQINIRKAVLAATPVVLPDIETQNTIA